MIVKLQKYEWVQWVDRLQSTGTLQDEALVELREILLGGLIRAFRQRGGSVAFCEDVTQETLIKILAKVHTFRGDSKFTTWAISIGIRTGISHLRKMRLKWVSLESAVDDGLVLDISDSRSTRPELPQMKAAILDKLQQLIASELTSKQQDVVRAILSGMPVEVIASRTGRNRNAIYKMFHDARKKLRRNFEAAGISAIDLAEAFPCGKSETR